MRAIITGATGMIGIALTNELLAHGYSCVAIIRENSKKRSLLPVDPNLTIIECSIEHFNELEIEPNCDCFFHLAWEATTGQSRDDVHLQEQNIRYAIDSVGLAKRAGCETYVGVGSQAEYGIKSEMLSPITSVDPMNGYGIAKYATSKLTRIYANQLSMKHCWGRILSIYGPNDNPNSLISYLIKSFRSDLNVELTKCEQMWDYLYVKDCARALRLIAEKGLNNKVYIIGSGEAQLLKEYVKIVKKEIKSNSKVLFGAKEYYPNQPMYLCADIKELNADTGFVPKYTFEEGIKETIKYME